METSFGLSAYLAVSARSERIARWVQRRRLKIGKEDAERSEERFGKAGFARPEGRLAWFHSASVGEVLSLLTLVEVLGKERPDLSFLMTTGTVTSAEIFNTRIPPRALHQFVPFDVLPSVVSFLDHWKPDIAIWTESELWPAMICETHRREVPLLYINARMSRRSFRRWRWVPSIARSILNRFDHAIIQDEQTASRLRGLGLEGGQMETLGSLKRDAADLPCNDKDRVEFLQAVGERPVWLAASTHEGEEDIVGRAQLQLMDAFPELLLIVVPRHRERGQAIRNWLSTNGISVALRSADELPGPAHNVYVADTLGELGLWYRVASISFVGGSLVKIGGHNPFEPARLRSVILHGPHVANFASEFGELAKAGAALQVEDADQLATAVGKALTTDNTDLLMKAAEIASLGGKRVTKRVASVILQRLPQPEAG